MPKLPSLRVAVLAQLAEQLRYAPPAAARRHVERAEALLDQVRDAQAYPEDFVAFAITGYRPDVPEPAQIPGAALRSDLAPLIERLSATAAYRAQDLRGRWLDARDVCARWKISRKTLDRYRRHGLPGRRVRGERGRTRVVFDARRVERFLAAHRAALERAGGFSRIEPEMLDRLALRARRYQRAFRWSLARIARRLGERFARSPGAIRAALARAGFVDARPRRAGGPLGARERRLIERAARLGMPLASIGRALGRPAPSIHRALWLRRAELLRQGDPHAPIDAPPRLVVAPTALALQGLGRPAAHSVLEHLRQTLAEGWPDAQVERARLRALHELRAAARARLARVDRLWPESADVEEAGTCWLWAARVLAELVRSQQMMVLKSLEARFGVEPGELPPGLAARAIEACALAIADAALNMEAGRSTGRLAAPAGLIVNRTLARLQAALPPPPRSASGKATVVARATALDEVRLADWTRHLAPWQRWVEPRTWVRAFIDARPQGAAPHADVLAHRFGYPPAPHPVSSAALGSPARFASARVARALEAARQWARAQGAAPAKVRP